MNNRPTAMDRLNGAGVRMACDVGTRLVESRDVLAILEALRSPDGAAYIGPPHEQPPGGGVAA